MKLKDVKPKFSEVELCEYSDGMMFQAPQFLSFKTAVERYGDREVLFFADHEESSRTEVLIDKL